MMLTAHLVKVWKCLPCGDIYTAKGSEELAGYIWFHQLYFHGGEYTPGQFRVFEVNGYRIRPHAAS